MSHGECGAPRGPDLVDEVVSLSNVAHDYLTKAVLYKNAGAREYWIVDPFSRRTAVYRFDEPQTAFSCGYEFVQPAHVGIWSDELVLVIGDYL